MPDSRRQDRALSIGAIGLRRPLVLFFFLALAARAQTPAAGTLQGTVTDPAGAVIVGAEVCLRHLGTAAERVLKTTRSGRYVAAALPPGLYEVRFAALGFAPRLHTGVEVAVGQTVTLDVELPVGVVTEALTISGQPPLLEPEKTDVSSILGELAVRQLPTNGRRWEDFLLLTPAVAEDGGGGLISFRGLSGLYNNNLVDGADNNQAFFSESRGRSRLPYGYSLASIREFQVITQNYSAEFGRALGGLVNAVTRSGGERLHGEAFYFFTDDALLAQDPLAKARGQPKPEERRQQFGLALGGPLVRRKLFLFGTYDQQSRDFPITVVPLDPNFAAACTLPECAPAMDFVRNLLGVRPRRGDQNLFLLKPDWIPNQRHRLSAVLNVLRWRSPNGILRDPVVSDAAEAQGRDDVQAEFLTLTWQATPSAATLDEVRFQFGRDLEFQQQNTSGPLLDLTRFRALRVGMREFLPRVAFPNEQRWQWADNFTLVRGRHLIKFGADINYVRDTVIQIFRGGGIFRWSTANDFAQDFAGTCPRNGGRCYLDFVQAVDPVTGEGRGRFRTIDWNFFLQDSIRLRPGLSLTLGLRYELQQMPAPQRPNPAVLMNARLNTDTNNFAPRLGLAWQPGGWDRLVVRSGYGIYYGRTQNSTIFTHLFQNGVFQQAFIFPPTHCGAPHFPNVVFAPPPGAPLGPPAPGLPTPVVESPPPGCLLNPSRTAITTLAPDFVNPLVHQADLVVEYGLAPDWVVSAGYLFSRANRLPFFVDTNVAPATGTATYAVGDAQGRLTERVTLPLYTRRVDPTLGVIQTGLSVVNASYHAIVLELKKRFSRGLQLNAHFTLAKATDNGVLPAALGTFSSSLVPVDPFDLEREHALSDLDVRRRFVLYAHWELPRWELESRAARALAHGWKLSAIGQARDANPVSALVVGLPDICRTMGVNGGLTCGSADPFGLPASTYRAPHLGRNVFRGARSGRATLDLRLTREFPLAEGKRLEFSWDAFNLANRTHFTSFNTQAFEFVRPGATGTRSGLACPGTAGVDGCLFPLDDFLQPERSGTRILGARQMQFSLRFFF
ncbi:MAG: TonB-dependent receptor [Acidobacteria bacterium]|nr:TonB-dependent receptor [Acidobacteriota bacterium]